LKQIKKILYYIILSSVAVFLLLLLIFFGQFKSNINFFDRLIVAIIFIVCCLFGVSLAIYPRWYKRFKKHQDYNENNHHIIKTIELKGHHPNCNQFRNHILKIKNKFYCAGCLGLAIGSFISVLLMVFYIIIANEQISLLFQFLVIFGFIFIIITYIEIVLPLKHVIFHIISSILLVVSFFIITISIFELTGNKFYGMISILLSFLWLDTRVQLSVWHHKHICNNCNELCKMYR
jgi:hypothetical protein